MRMVILMTEPAGTADPGQLAVQHQPVVLDFCGTGRAGLFVHLNPDRFLVRQDRAEPVADLLRRQRRVGFDHVLDEARAPAGSWLSSMWIPTARGVTGVTCPIPARSCGPAPRARPMAASCGVAAR